MMVPAPSEIRIGTVLRETYELTGLLGRGGMGLVFEARHLRLPGKSFAVKILTTGPDVGPEIHARFRREAEIIARLGHPNIVAVIDYHTLENGTPYLVLERLRGETLSQRIWSGPLPIGEALSIARQVGSALHSAHRAGVVHRDLKPANIFLIPSDSGGVVTQTVKLLDFGISKISGELSSLHTQEEVLIGTPQYMSPEQAQGKNRQLDARSDLFALGCIVYEMLSGVSPFAGDGIAEVVYKVVNTEPQPLLELRAGLEPRIVKAVLHALAKRADDRCSSVSAFIVELTGNPLKTLSNPDIPLPSLLAALPLPMPATIASPSRSAKPASRSSRSGKRRMLGLGIAAVLGLGVVAGAVLARNEAPWRKGPAPTIVSPAPDLPVSLRAPTTIVPTVETTAEPDTDPDETEGSGHVGGKKRPRAILPPAAMEDLTAAEQALSQGNTSEALRLARRSQRQGVSGKAVSVIVRTHCLQGDLSNARAQYRHVPAGERPRVVSFCKLRGIEF